MGDGVSIDGTSEAAYLSETYTTPIIVLSGDQAASGPGLNLTGSTSTIEGLVIDNFSGDGIDVGGNFNVIQADYIGTDEFGTTAAPNTGDGIYVTGADNTIGGTTAGSGNVISGNTGDGIHITGTAASYNVVEGNFIGTDVTGTTTIGTDNNPLGNGGNGVYIADGATGNIIGGDSTTGAGNVISGNLNNGVAITGGGTTGNVVAGDIIGLDYSGSTAFDGNDNPLGNAGGVELDGGASGNTIGGATAGAANIISGNLYGGVGLFTGATGNIVQGNLIGTDSTGETALGNGGNGVTLTGVPDNSILGNTIAGSSSEGVEIYGVVSTGNVVQGNRIGTDALGTSPLGNQENGVQIEAGASGNIIGGTDPGDGNVIAFNASDAVQIGAGATDASTGNAVEGNSIHDNGSIGIDLGGDGPTTNDSQPHTGPNLFQDYPLITSAQIDGNGDLQVAYSDPTDSGSTDPITVDFYLSHTDGQGETYLGYSLTPGTVDLGNAAALGFAPGKFIVATATDAAGNTSEFSPIVTVANANNLYVVSNTNDSGPGSLRSALSYANNDWRPPPPTPTSSRSPSEPARRRSLSLPLYLRSPSPS